MKVAAVAHDQHHAVVDIVDRTGRPTGLVGSETCLFPGLAAGPFGSRGMWPPASLIIEARDSL